LVTALLDHEDPITTELLVEGEWVETTPEHPFYTQTGWLPAGEITSGMYIRQADGDYAVVEQTAVKHQPQTMYNLTVETAHTYFVGQGQWLVHNECDPNIDPSAAREKVRLEYAKGAGLCDKCAVAIHEQFGDPIYVYGNKGGTSMDIPDGWISPDFGDSFHAITVDKNGIVWDNMTGNTGLTAEKYFAKLRENNPNLITNYPDGPVIETNNDIVNYVYRVIRR
jgi:hypothetical protein